MNDLEYNIDFQMKKDILKMWDDKKIKLGQRIPIMKYTTKIPNQTNFADLIITESLIKRLRTEMRDNWR